MRAGGDWLSIAREVRPGCQEMPVARRLGDSRRRLGWLLAILLALALLLAGAVYGVYRLLSTRVE